MDFTYIIEFWYGEGGFVRRVGIGQFYPTDRGDVMKIEDMLWVMSEQYGRPTHVQTIYFFGEDHGQNASKYLEDTKAEKTRTPHLSHT